MEMKPGNEKFKPGGYGHALIPQSLIKKSNLIILRFLTLIYEAAHNQKLTPDTVGINMEKMIRILDYIEKQVCSFVPKNPKEREDFYRKLMILLEDSIPDCICESSSSSPSPPGHDGRRHRYARRNSSIDAPVNSERQMVNERAAVHGNR